jgi:polyphosphate glucokinase
MTEEARDLTLADDPPTPPPGTRIQGRAVGIDVGGTGIKGALVDLGTGELASERIRVKTPRPGTPEQILAEIEGLVERLGEAVTPGMPLGCGLPGVVKYGVLKTAANIDQSWIDFPISDELARRLGRPVLVLNDADAAGIAEMTYGAGEGVPGTVLLLTLGTGIGSALFIDGHLVPNTELGHLSLHGRDAEKRVSAVARERRKLDWKTWAREFNEYVALIEAHLWPDLILLGGGGAKELDKYHRHLVSRAPIKAAELLNLAGIVGVAYAAAAVHGAPEASSDGTGRTAGSPTPRLATPQPGVEPAPGLEAGGVETPSGNDGEAATGTTAVTAETYGHEHWHEHEGDAHSHWHEHGPGHEAHDLWHGAPAGGEGGEGAEHGEGGEHG